MFLDVPCSFSNAWFKKYIKNHDQSRTAFLSLSHDTMPRTGDNSGSWDFIRMQIPTIIGSGLSGFAHASGDVDGIFHGSAETYVPGTLISGLVGMDVLK